MSDEYQVNSSSISLSKGDITDMEIDAFVYYATEDLKLGSGFGTAIAIRGGPSVQKELDEIGGVKLTEATVTKAGEMKANWIIHAVGPKFQEENLEDKLKETILNVMKLADEKGIEEIAFPPMGAGFYGVPLDLSAEITLETIKSYLKNGDKTKKVVISLLDNRDYIPFQKKLKAMN